MPKQKLDWRNILFIGTAHLLAVTAVVYLVAIRFSWWTVGLGLIWLVLCGVSITGGYHRLFSHRTYKANGALRLFYLLFGAASVQNSALKWSADHRTHHAHTDTSEDPYSVRRGFWWAHVGWVLRKDRADRDIPAMRDLINDWMVRFQHKNYVPLALLFGAAIPMAFGLIWRDPIGALLVAGFLRMVVQWHATFSVNSFAHLIGAQPYSTKTTARDSAFTAFITLGEGYHNFHHRFQSDYRNGIRWYQLDPTKWFVWTLSKVGVTSGLKRAPKEAISQARAEVRANQR